jgi:hypothetical protein
VLFARRRAATERLILQHGNDITTLYGHLSRFVANLRWARVRYRRVRLARRHDGARHGPHLHYEYRVAGVHKNPRTVPLPQADPIARLKIGVSRSGLIDADRRRS